MNIVAYIGRAINRLTSKGVANTFRYSANVVRNSFLSVYIDLRYGRKFSKTRSLSHLSLSDVTAIDHSPYHVLFDLFRLEPIMRDDILVDVGCGDGRVINFWLSMELKNKIVGIEIDPATSASTAHRFSRYQNVAIVNADATKTPIEGTVFYLFNPFGGQMMKDFEHMMRGKKVKVIIYNFLDLSAFDAGHWLRRDHISTRDECQYRAAIFTPAYLNEFVPISNRPASRA